jgi:vanillate O-demethylase ferredoxin subunit
MNHEPVKHDFYVHAITHEAEGIASFEFRPNAGSVAPPMAGAHIDVVLPNGLTRQYSLTNAAGETGGYRVAVKRDARSRGGSQFMHEALRVGTPLTVSAPRNNFPLREDARHSAFVAGGIGITPIVSMIERLVALGQSWELVYAVRSRRDAAFLHRLTAGRGQAHVHVDDEVGGAFGVGAHVRNLPANADVYCCGPAPMLDAFLEATAERDQTRIHIERFAATPLEPRRGTFVVELARSKMAVTVADGESILTALRNAGISTVSSCEEGVCGTCETAVLDGRPDHRDSVLSAAERSANASMMICCSGSATARLVLDL